MWLSADCLPVGWSRFTSLSQRGTLASIEIHDENSSLGFAAGTRGFSQNRFLILPSHPGAANTAAFFWTDKHRSIGDDDFRLTSGVRATPFFTLVHDPASVTVENLTSQAGPLNA